LLLRLVLSSPKIFSFILAVYGLFLIVFTFVKIFNDPQSFTTLDNLRAFALPVLLTLAYIPFLYMGFPRFSGHKKWLIDKSIQKRTNEKVPIVFQE